MFRHRTPPGWMFYPGWVIGSAISFPIAVTDMPEITRVVGDRIVVGGQSHVTKESHYA